MFLQIKKIQGKRDLDLVTAFGDILLKSYCFDGSIVNVNN